MHAYFGGSFHVWRLHTRFVRRGGHLGRGEAPVKYIKPALTIEQQVQLLQSRGLSGDHELMASKLREVSYYRLSGYTFPFRDAKDVFRAGTSFELVWDHYVFDRQLRLLVLDAIERVEVSVRTRLAYELAHQRGPFALWNDPSTLLVPTADRSILLDKLREEVRRNEKEQFLKHFFQKYGDEHDDPPIWMLSEILSFGHVVRLVDGMERPVRDAITSAYGVPDQVLISWLRTLNFVRNVCAHHGRLWNRVLSYRVLIPNERKYPDWHRPIPIPNDRLFTVVTVLRHLLRVVSPGSEWDQRLRALLSQYPSVNPRSMGFPSGWERSPLWMESMG